MSAETKHSPEPWVYWDNGFDAGIVSEQDVANAHAKSVCPSIIFGGEPCEGRVEADDPNVRRTIACVNACAGIPTEALEAGRIGEALGILRDSWEGDRDDVFGESDVRDVLLALGSIA
jgi:hypothetical protein